MKTIEDIISLMVVGAWSAKRHRQAPTAQAVTQFRQTLLTDVKAISANGSAELIVAMGKALVQHDLEYYANSKTMIGSLNTALSEFAIRRLSMILKNRPLRRASPEYTGHSSTT